MGDEFQDQWKKDSPKSFEWHQKLVARPAVKKALDARDAKLAENK
jgi:glutathione S-transferase